MENNFKLVPLPDKVVNSQLVADIEKMLQDAKSGELITLMAIGLGPDNQRSSFSILSDHKNHRIMQLLGEAECLKQRIIDVIRVRNSGDI